MSQMYHKEVAEWKEFCGNKFGHRYCYPPDEEFGDRFHNKIRIYDKEKKEYFLQTPFAHMNSKTGKTRAPSALEKTVSKILVRENIPFEEEYAVQELGISHLDFLVNGTIVIECQGQQHYRPVEGMGGESKAITQLLNDRHKAVTLANKGFTVVYFSVYDYPEEFKTDFIHYFTIYEKEEFLRFIIRNLYNPVKPPKKQYTIEKSFQPFEGFGNYSQELQERVVYEYNNSPKYAADIAHEFGLTDQDIIAILKLNGISSSDLILKHDLLGGKPIFTINEETGKIDNAFLTIGEASNHLESLGYVSRAENKFSAPISRRLKQQKYAYHGEYYRYIDQADSKQLKIINSKLKERYPVKVLKWLGLAS